jgi:hypothetical protein
MSNNDGRVIVAEKNIDTLMDALQQLQERDREKTVRLENIEKKMSEVDVMQKELYATLHTINLKALGDAVRQLQEKYRELKRMME